MARIGQIRVGRDRRLAEIAEIGELERPNGGHPADVGWKRLAVIMQKWGDAMKRCYKINLLGVIALGLVVTSNMSWAQQVLKVGAAPSAPPLSYLPNTTTDYHKTVDPKLAQGANVDLMNAVASELGFKIEFVALPPLVRIDAVKEKAIDLAVGFYTTDPVASLLDFAAPIYRNGDAVVVPNVDKKEYGSWEDMTGMVVGVLKGSAMDGPAQKSGLFKEVKIFDLPADAEHAASTGQIQAMFDANVISETYKFNPATGTPAQLAAGLRVVKTYNPRFPATSSFAVLKGNTQLLGQIDATLPKLKANGSIQAIFAKYGIDSALSK